MLVKYWILTLYSKIKSRSIARGRERHCNFSLFFIIAYKAVPHIINSSKLSGEKPCINEAIHALLMHSYATFSMLVPGHRTAAVKRCVLPGPRTSIVHGNCVRKISVKCGEQNNARNNTKSRKCFQFLCNNSHRTRFFNVLTFARSLGRWQLLMHENHV